MIQVTSKRSARGNANNDTSGHVPDGDAEDGSKANPERHAQSHP